MLVSCGADDIRVWEMPSGEYLGTASTLLDDKDEPESEHPTLRAKRKKTEELAYRWSACAMSPREVLAVGSADGELAFYDWKVPQAAPIATATGPARRVYHFRPYQFTKTKSIPGTLPGEGGINAMAFDFSGTRLITAESDKSVKVWKLKDT
ncbi:unnamed protein product [Phytomonas sp. EM1]|nr:unnamed protein product [Phytomonas sp. EM1]|eukprot:CCW63864.1 unnamed protein product [Phytomonas sp. isolate EM1]